MKVKQRLGAIYGWARNGIRAHPFFSSCVAYLVLKQMLVIWAFIESPQAPPNTFLALSGAALLSLSWAFVLRGRLRLLALAAVDVAYGVLLLTDLIYFRQFADLPSVASLRHAGLMGGLHGVIEDLIRPTDVLLFLGPVLLVALAAARRPWLQRQRHFDLRRAALLTGIGFALLASVGLTTRRLKKPFGGHTMVASRVGPIGYHAYDAGTYLGRGLKKRFGSTEEAYAEARAFFDAKQAQPNAGGKLAGAFAGKNVIIVQIESWQAFPTEMEVGGEPVTPHFNALAKESIHLTRMHSQVGQGTTSDAEFTAQCSLYALRTGSVYYEHATNDLRCFPEILREAGYTTAAMHANRPDFWNRAAMYPTVGISTYFDERSYSGGEEIGLGLSDEDFFDQTVDKLKALQAPYYALVISLTSHTPFNFPNLPRELDHGDFARTRVAHYLDTVRYTDRALGKLVERLRSEGMLDESILVVYGDHMGVARDSSNVGDFLALSDDDAPAWFRTERRIPALIRLPGGAGAGALSATAGQIDVAPTVAALLGIESENVFLGRNLLAGGEGFVTFPNGSAASDDRLYLTADGGHGKPGCYELPSGEQVPGSECEGISTRAARELGLSWSMVESDLVARVAGARGHESRPVTAL